MLWKLEGSAPLTLTCMSLAAQAKEKHVEEESQLAARIAYETKAEFEREEAARTEAKRALKDYLMA